MPTYYYGCWPVPQGWDPNMPMSHAECAGVLDGCYHFYSWCNPATNYPEGFRNAPMAHVKRSQVQQPNNTMQLLEGIGWPGGTYDYWDCTECWGGNDWNVTNGWGTPYNSSSFVRRHRGGQLALMCDGTTIWTHVEDTCGSTFANAFHANNLSWDTEDSWSQAVQNQTLRRRRHARHVVDHEVKIHVVRLRLSNYPPLLRGGSFESLFVLCGKSVPSDRHDR